MKDSIKMVLRNGIKILLDMNEHITFQTVCDLSKSFVNSETYAAVEQARAEIAKEFNIF